MYWKSLPVLEPLQLMSSLEKTLLQTKQERSFVHVCLRPHVSEYECVSGHTLYTNVIYMSMRGVLGGVIRVCYWR